MTARHVLVMALLGLMAVFVAWFGGRTSPTAELLVFALPPLALAAGVLRGVRVASFWAGVLIFTGLYGFSLWATNRDPDMLRIIVASSGTRRRYDPGKHERFDVEIVRW